MTLGRELRFEFSLFPFHRQKWQWSSHLLHAAAAEWEDL